MTKMVNICLSQLNIQKITPEQTLPLRQQVLWPAASLEDCRLADDEIGWHFGGFYQQELVCVASVFIDQKKARLRKFATLPAYQGQGIGQMMLTRLLAELSQQAVTQFWCDARETAIGFYQRFDMQVQGERFYKSDVAYRKMTLELEPKEAAN